ncbi:MAG: DUF3102 domain-containing protein [Cyanobacteria bacterium P01_G01_bin.19]
MNLQKLANKSSFESSHKPTFDASEQYSFNYDVLDPKTQISIKQTTFEIKILIRQAARDIVEVGQKLVAVKKQLKHGEFRNWLKAEFDWSVSSATKFMQVYDKFKNINFTHFDFSASALYALAAPSTPESARKHALELADRGESITYSLAKQIVKHHKELEKIDFDSSNRHSFEQKTLPDTADTSVASKPSTIDPVRERVHHKPDKSVRIVEIKQEISKYIEDKVQDFHIVYAGTCIAVEGSPKDLTILFKKMQNNPEFAEDIFRQAQLISE